MAKKGKTSLGLEENVEAALAYVLGWLTGLIFLLIEKESKYVRFHAAQSIVTFLGFTVIYFVLALFALIPFVSMLVGLFSFLVGILALLTWIYCLIKALQGENFELPIAGNIAKNIVK